MIDEQSRSRYRTQFARMLSDARIAILPAEEYGVELTDFGLGEFEQEGLGLIVYVNNERYCAKELLMLPRQTCPQHRHPPVGNDPGKTETFRCRTGSVFLYVDGPSAAAPVAQAPRGKEAFYTVWSEVELKEGMQYTIPANTWHWFQAGPDGAIVSEFSSTSRDEADIFVDPKLQRLA